MNKPENLIKRTDVEGSPIQFIDLKAQQNQIRDEVEAAINRVLDHGRYIMGPEIEELEAALGKYTGATHVVGCASGTDALIIPLMAEGVGAGDAVFIPGFTYNATANAVLLAGATPVFVDINLETFNIDVKDLADKVAQVKSAGQLNPKAVIAVDLYGLPADYAAITKLCQDNDLFLLADAAQSFGGGIGDKMVGDLAPATATSFFPSKTLGCYGDGGAMFTSDADTAELWRSILFHGTDSARRESLRVGMNGRLDSMQAAVLLVKLSIFEQEWKNRDRVASIYNERLKGRLALASGGDTYRSSWGLYSCLAKDAGERDRLQSHLKTNGIPTAIYYTAPLNRHSAFAAYSPEGGLPVCEDAASRIFSLPMHPYLTEEQANRICDAILEVN